jgi:hypothetical protein
MTGYTRVTIEGRWYRVLDDSLDAKPTVRLRRDLATTDGCEEVKALPLHVRFLDKLRHGTVIHLLEPQLPSAEPNVSALDGSATAARACASAPPA